MGWGTRQLLLAEKPVPDPSALALLASSPAAQDMGPKEPEETKEETREETREEEPKAGSCCFFPSDVGLGSLGARNVSDQGQ